MEQPEAKQVRGYLNAIALALARLDALADGDEKRALTHTANRALRAIEAIVNRDITAPGAWLDQRTGR